MINYPVHFQAVSHCEPGINSSWRVQSSGYDTQCSVPKEFEGCGECFSPEDFFLMSVQNCFVATFKVFAQYSRLNFESLNVSAKLKVDKDSEGKPWMEEVHLEINLQGIQENDLRKAQTLIQKTLDNGFILRSVKSRSLS